MEARLSQPRGAAPAGWEPGEELLLRCHFKRVFALSICVVCGLLAAVLLEALVLNRFVAPLASLPLRLLAGLFLLLMLAGLGAGIYQLWRPLTLLELTSHGLRQHYRGADGEQYVWLIPWPRIQAMRYLKTTATGGHSRTRVIRALELELAVDAGFQIPQGVSLLRDTHAGTRHTIDLINPAPGGERLYRRIRQQWLARCGDATAQDSARSR